MKKRQGRNSGPQERIRYGSSAGSGSGAYARREPPPDPVLMGALSLVEQLDKLVVVVLRDKRTFRGILRSFDGYANVILENAVERIYVDDCYCDVAVRGWFIARAENVVLLGEIDVARKDADTINFKLVEEAEIMRLRKEQRKKEDEKKKLLMDFFDELLQDEF